VSCRICLWWGALRETTRETQELRSRVHIFFKFGAGPSGLILKAEETFHKDCSGLERSRDLWKCID
jgi:hypothetical protein